jgi:hypothetical protein
MTLNDSYFLSLFSSFFLSSVLPFFIFYFLFFLSFFLSLVNLVLMHACAEQNSFCCLKYFEDPQVASQLFQWCIYSTHSKHHACNVFVFSVEYLGFPGQIYKDDVDGFSSMSDMFFVHLSKVGVSVVVAHKLTVHH